MTRDRFAIGTYVQFVFGEPGGSSITEGTVTNASEGVISLRLYGDQDATLVFGGQRIVPGIQVVFRPEGAPLHVEPWRVTKVSDSKIDMNDPDGDYITMLLDAKPIFPRNDDDAVPREGKGA